MAEHLARNLASYFRPSGGAGGERTAADTANIRDYFRPGAIESWERTAGAGRGRRGAARQTARRAAGWRRARRASDRLPSVALRDAWGHVGQARG